LHYDRFLYLVIVNKIDCAPCLIAPSPAVMAPRVQAEAVNNQKGGSNVVDHFCDLTDFVAAGIDQRIHNGRSYSYPADYCRHRVSGTTSSREKNIVASWATSLMNDVFGKDAGNQAPKDFTEV